MAPRPRRAIVDASLLGSLANRHFVGLVAEKGNVVMCGTSVSRVEDHVAVRKIALSRLPEDQIAERVARDLARLEGWRDGYRQAGLWEDLPDGQMSSGRAPETRAIMARRWASRPTRPTDPKDEHLVVAAAVYGLDAVFTANMAMVESVDWQPIFDDLDAGSPILCRRESLVDWALGIENSKDKAAALVSLMLSALTSVPDLKTPLQRWLNNIQAAFPEHSASGLTYLESQAEERLQAVHAEVSGAGAPRTTRTVMRTSMTTRGP